MKPSRVVATFLVIIIFQCLTTQSQEIPWMVACSLFFTKLFTLGRQQGLESGRQAGEMMLASRICATETITAPNNLPRCVRCGLISDPATCMADPECNPAGVFCGFIPIP